MWCLLSLSIPNNYLHHTLEPTQQRGKGFPSDDGRRENRRQFIIQIYDGITNKSKLNKTDLPVTTSENMKTQNGLVVFFFFENLFPLIFFPPPIFLTIITHLQCRMRIQKNKKSLQIHEVSFSHTFLKQFWPFHSHGRKIGLASQQILFYLKLLCCSIAYWTMSQFTWNKVILCSNEVWEKHYALWHWKTP